MMRMSHIQRIVANKYGITREMMLDKNRLPGNVVPRHIAMYFCKELTNNSSKQIAFAFKRCNHTTVLSAIKNIEEAQEDIKKATKLFELRNEIINTWKLHKKLKLKEYMESK